MHSAQSLGSEMTPIFLRKLVHLSDFYVGFLTAIQDISSDLHTDFKIPQEDLTFIKSYFDQVKIGDFNLVDFQNNFEQASEILGKIYYLSSTVGNISNTHIFRHRKMGERKISIINYAIPPATRQKIISFHSYINNFFTVFYRELFLETGSTNNFSQNVCGFVHGKSYLDHAKAHVMGKTIISIDIKKFYDSIILKNIFTSRLFFRAFSTSARLHNVSEEDPVVNGMIAICSGILACLSNYMTHNGVVPTGAHYSPSFSNFIFAGIDEQILNVIKEKNSLITYTRYADDIAISTPVISIDDKYVIDMDLIRKIESVVNSFTFYLKYEKTKIMGPKDKKVIAGVIIDQSDFNNPKLSIGTQRKLELKAQFSGRRFTDLTASEKGILNWVNQVNPHQYNFVISEMIME